MGGSVCVAGDFKALCARYLVDAQGTVAADVIVVIAFVIWANKTVAVSREWTGHVSCVGEVGKTEERDFENGENN